MSYVLQQDEPNDDPSRPPLNVYTRLFALAQENVDIRVPNPSFPTDVIYEGPTYIVGANSPFERERSIFTSTLLTRVAVTGPEFLGARVWIGVLRPNNDNYWLVSGDEIPPLVTVELPVSKHVILSGERLVAGVSTRDPSSGSGRVCQLSLSYIVNRREEFTVLNAASGQVATSPENIDFSPQQQPLGALPPGGGYMAPTLAAQYSEQKRLVEEDHTGVFVRDFDDQDPAQ
jgi:hypothetical protein